MHHKVSVIYKKPIKERSFSKWTISFNKIGKEYFEETENLIEIYKNAGVKKHSKEVREVREVVELLRMECLRTKRCFNKNIVCTKHY